MVTVDYILQLHKLITKALKNNETKYRRSEFKEFIIKLHTSYGTLAQIICENAVTASFKNLSKFRPAYYIFQNLFSVTIVIVPELKGEIS